MKQVRILWTDDEIDLLRPHILFLKEKGYDVITASNGDDAIDIVTNETLDLVFLDENMPGMSGLQTLSKIKELKPTIPVIMITKSEEEDIMDAAIGSQIHDYLIKPVNPNQILLTIKKNIDTKKLISKETTSAYQSEFSQIGMQISMARDFNEWSDIYRKLNRWEIELEKSDDSGMNDVLKMQKTEANVEFSKYIKNHYLDWFDSDSKDKPLLSPTVIRDKVLPLAENSEKLAFIVIDNMRFDQWKTIQPDIEEFFQVEEESEYFSILPTATQYSRNSIFAGLMPSDIAQLYPDLWLNDDDEGGKNQYEADLLQTQLNRLGFKGKHHFEKINNSRTSNKLISQINNLLNNDILFLVYNFVDMLSHANTDVEMVRELAHDDAAYRSLTKSWFQHSDLKDLLRCLAEKNIKVILTTDHGTIRVQKPVKVVGDRTTSKNLRYKLGKNLGYNSKEVFEITAPHLGHLPKSSVSSRYIFALENDFFAYPNNYNHYVSYYTNTYQHGGVSLEEMILPFIVLQSKLT
ncbi:MAG: PglZ domain-containing protein [Bacteroidales bacterium]|nr:PglZ domain-containing protein [Bacteroidales bacterium]